MNERKKMFMVTAGSSDWAKQIRLAAIEGREHGKDHRVRFLVEGDEQQQNIG